MVFVERFAGPARAEPWLPSRAEGVWCLGQSRFHPDQSKLDGRVGLVHGAADSAFAGSALYR